MSRTRTLKMKPGKPAPVAVRDWKADFIDAFEESLSVIDAAAQADVPLVEFRQALRDDPEFALAYRSTLVAQGEKVQKAMIERAIKGDPACARLVLPALLPEVYGNRVTIDINVNSPSDLHEVSDEKLAEVKATCLKLQNS